MNVPGAKLYATSFRYLVHSLRFISKISMISPIAKGLLGKKAGEIAEITVPAGKIEFEILEISR